MKRIINRQEVKVLYVLGAGASYASSLGANGKFLKSSSPLDKEFSSIIKEMDFQKPKWVSRAKENILKNWKDHRDFESFGLEEAIINQTSHLEFIKSIQPIKNTSYEASNFIREISHLISFRLNKSRESRFKYYRSLSNKFLKNIKGPKDFKNRIITFNYDILLDQHLLKKFNHRQLYFDNLQDDAENKKRKSTQKFQHPIMLKLHGSINWRCKNEEFDKILQFESNSDEFKIDNIWYDPSEKSPQIDDEYSPCLIPPISSKPINKISLFKYLWTKASEYLSECEELIICGYSLPSSDNIAMSLFSHFSNKKINKVTIIDPDPIILKKWRDLLHRKGVSKAKWSYYYDFQEFCEDKN